MVLGNLKGWSFSLLRPASERKTVPASRSGGAGAIWPSGTAPGRKKARPLPMGDRVL